jgi:hypothetical protein
MLSSTALDDALRTLGALLAAREQTASLVLVGGGALVLLGLADRSTKDLDVVARVEAGHLREAEPFSLALQEAIADVALALDLAPDWLNPGPAALLRLGLPDGFQSRAHHRDYGAVQVWLADRLDQIHLKLYAAADHWPDRSRHLRDLEGLAPSADELRTAARWCQSHDPSDGFRDMLLAPVLRYLGVETLDG